MFNYWTYPKTTTVNLESSVSLHSAQQNNWRSKTYYSRFVFIIVPRTNFGECKKRKTKNTHTQKHTHKIKKKKSIHKAEKKKREKARTSKITPTRWIQLLLSVFGDSFQSHWLAGSWSSCPGAQVRLTSLQVKWAKFATDVQFTSWFVNRDKQMWSIAIRVHDRLCMIDGI